MKIAIGGSFGEPNQDLDTERVRFVAPDGRDMFEVSVGKDGFSIEVRGIASTRVDGVLYREQFDIEPNCSNCVTIRAKKYDA